MGHSKEVEQTIRDLIEEWNTKFNMTPQEINNGSCVMFAMDIMNECDFVTLVETRNKTVTGQVTLENVDEPAHIWVTDGTYHYDSETPTGVKNWKELPIFQRQLDD